MHAAQGEASAAADSLQLPVHKLALRVLVRIIAVGFGNVQNMLYNALPPEPVHCLLGGDHVDGGHIPQDILQILLQKGRSLLGGDVRVQRKHAQAGAPGTVTALLRQIGPRGGLFRIPGPISTLIHVDTQVAAGRRQRELLHPDQPPAEGIRAVVDELRQGVRHRLRDVLGDLRRGRVLVGILRQLHRRHRLRGRFAVPRRPGVGRHLAAAGGQDCQQKKCRQQKRPSLHGGRSFPLVMTKAFFGKYSIAAFRRESMDAGGLSPHCSHL